MDSATVIQIISEVIGGLVIVAGIITTIVLYIRARVQNGTDSAKASTARTAITELQVTVEAVKTQNGLQAGQIKTLTDNNKSLSDVVSELRGKVDTLSTIPLDKIEKHMADTNKILQAILPLIPSTTIEHSIMETTVTKK